MHKIAMVTAGEKNFWAFSVEKLREICKELDK